MREHLCKIMANGEQICFTRKGHKPFIIGKVGGAIYIIGIAKAHTFPDGNKRISFLSATYFLDINGYALEENSELPNIIEQEASGAIDRHRLGSFSGLILCQFSVINHRLFNIETLFSKLSNI